MKDHKILRSGISDEVEILDETQMENILGGITYCAKGYSFDESNNPVCQCGYLVLPDPILDPLPKPLPDQPIEID